VEEGQERQRRAALAARVHYSLLTGRFLMVLGSPLTTLQKRHHLVVRDPCSRINCDRRRWAQTNCNGSHEKPVRPSERDPPPESTDGADDSKCDSSELASRGARTEVT